MIGAILGDMIGSPYEFGTPLTSKQFPLFSDASEFTDDTILLIAVGDALMSLNHTISLYNQDIRGLTQQKLRYYCGLYPDLDYGIKFAAWLSMRDPMPYNSYGDGAVVRATPAAWLFSKIEDVLYVAQETSEITHNHPESIKGVKAVTSAIHYAREGKSKQYIQEYLSRQFGYQFNAYGVAVSSPRQHNETCMRVVPEAISAFLLGDSFEDVIRTAIIIGSDTDTVAAIAGEIAEAYYGIPDNLRAECYNRLPSDLLDILYRFENKIQV